MSHRPFFGSPVAAPAARSDKRPTLNDGLPWGGFGATVKDTLAQGTGHGGEGEEMAGGLGSETSGAGVRTSSLRARSKKRVAIADHPLVTTCGIAR
jgi:hypothetical protein